MDLEVWKCEGVGVIPPPWDPQKGFILPSVWGWILKCGNVRGLVSSPLPGPPRKVLSSLAKFGLFNVYAHAAAHTFGEFHAWKSGDNLVCLSFFYGFIQQGL